MNQKQKLVVLATRLANNAPNKEENHKIVQVLHQVLAEAQNRPPQGAADGSVDEQFWYKARDFITAYEQMMRGFATLFDEPNILRNVFSKF